MKTNIYYSGYPKQIRIKSEKLNLDHICITDFLKSCITFEDIQSLLESPFVDEVWLYVVKGALLYVSCDSKKFESFGPDEGEGFWFHLDPEEFELIDYHKINIWDVIEP